MGYNLNECFLSLNEWFINECMNSKNFTCLNTGWIRMFTIYGTFNLRNVLVFVLVSLTTKTILLPKFVNIYILFSKWWQNFNLSVKICKPLCNTEHSPNTSIWFLFVFYLFKEPENWLYLGFIFATIKYYPQIIAGRLFKKN